MSFGYVMYSAAFEFVSCSRSEGLNTPATLSPCQYASAEPWNWFVPLFVITLITAPVEPPYSAE